MESALCLALVDTQAGGGSSFWLVLQNTSGFDVELVLTKLQEGLLTVVVAIMAYFTLYDFPETASFLTEEERAFVVHRLKYDNQNTSDPNNIRVAQADDLSWRYVRAAFSDWQIWVNIIL